MSDGQPKLMRFMQSIQSKAVSGSTFYPSTLGDQKSVKSGWLRKQGGVVKSWHRRWFTLKGDTLYYYSSEDESKSPLGSIFLPSNKVFEIPSPGSPDPEKFLFEVGPGEGRSQVSGNHATYQICAATNEERKEWIKAIRKVMYAEKGGAIFGQAVDETMKYEHIKDPHKKVPTIVEMCVDYLRNNALDIEGLFRLPGRNSFVKELKEMFDVGERPDFVALQTDVHSVASLLKAYLRDLPESIIPVQFYDAVRKIVVRDVEQSPEKAYPRMYQLLSNIPPDNYNLLHYLCDFLYEVASFSEKNKMTPMNLATVFAQSIIMPESDDPAILMGTSNVRTRVVHVLISECKNIFKMEYNPLGSAVHIDSLVDLENETSTAENQQSTLAFNEDLLGLDWSVPPEAVEQPGEEPQYSEIPGEEDETFVEAPENSAPIYEEPTQDDMALQEPVDDAFEDEPLYARVNHDRLKRSRSAKNRSMTVYSESHREPPVPAPRMQRSVQDSVSSLDECPTDERVEALLGVTLDDLSEEDLLQHTQAVRGELRNQRDKYADLLSKFRDLQTEHAQKMHRMAQNLSDEKVSTKEAVDRIVNLQSELHEYQMKFGALG